ncbi:50S ribosomal protein L23 [Gammaproteobacteria bacterium]|jgi:large subunit ribosomal protein L23|nr:50S ribosomal protein L23 [Gammaproteobacteria bacterium]|tara:strand:- start:360 stop:656 length:297 start_codon:yes stop_codon:yes gene_type:complete
MNKQNLYRIIESPHVTEKTSALSINNNQVVFRVNKSATKNQIKKAVEELFSVSVTSVSTSISKGKTKRNRFGVYRRSNFKKAFVSLKQGDEIKFEGIS